jgi:hypothetical protein
MFLDLRMHLCVIMMQQSRAFDTQIIGCDRFSLKTVKIPCTFQNAEYQDMQNSNFASCFV